MSYININNLQKRYESTLRRISYLSSLRKEVCLSEPENIDNDQWAAIQLPLSAVENRLITLLKIEGRKYLPSLYKPEIARRMNFLLGKIDIDFTDAMVFFDTYMDILSQRKMPLLGKLLRGCDKLAKDAMFIDHPIFRDLELPLVSCERGFGALIIRPGVTFPGNIKNPVPLIQIPYSRIVAKYDLTSIAHEVGHFAMITIGLDETLQRVFRTVLRDSWAPKEIIDLFVLWSSEIGPDFWAFCCSGIAQTASIKEMLSLPPHRVFYVSYEDVHPAIYVRILLSIEWCRQKWGRGVWDYWEKEWYTLYPLRLTSSENAKTLQTCKKYIPAIASALINTRFRVLDGKKLTDLFDMSVLNPRNLERIARSVEGGTLNLKGIRPFAQLAVFRLIRDKKKFNEKILDKVMTNWLIKLGRIRDIPLTTIKSSF